MFSYNKPKLKDFYDKMPVFVQNLMTSLYGLQHRRRVHGRYYPIYLEALKKSQWYMLMIIAHIGIEFSANWALSLI
jgi:hypothetical protein